MSDKSALNTTPDFSGLRLNVRLEHVDGAPRMHRLRITLGMAMLDISNMGNETQLEVIDECTLLVANGTLHEDDQ